LRGARQLVLGRGGLDDRRYDRGRRVDRGGGWLGARIGVMTAFIVSMVGTGIGIYAGRRIAASVLG
jgi:hypothetical protein